MAVTINVNITKGHSISVDGVATYTLKYEVTSTTNIDDSIFIFERDPSDSTDYFYTVSTPAHIEEYPSTEPLDTFFRLDSVELEFTSTTDRETAATRIELRIGELAEDYQIWLTANEGLESESYSS